jgi:hypothetical protein
MAVQYVWKIEAIVNRINQGLAAVQVAVAGLL